jgi:prepilin signal peptidase PulO-like enzyme (type II secretory pathway)
MLYTFVIPFQQKGAGLFSAVPIIFAICRYVRLSLTANDRLDLLYSLVSLLTFLLFSVIGSLHMTGGSRYGLPVHSGMLAIAFSGISLDKQTLSDRLYKLSLVVLVLLTIASFFKMDSVYSVA